MTSPTPIKPVDWTQYEPCETCLVDIKEPCINLHTNDAVLWPHAGRERLQKV